MVGIVAILFLGVLLAASQTSRTNETILVSGKLLCSLVSEPQFGHNQSCTLNDKVMSPVRVSLVVQGPSGTLSGRGVTTGLPGSPFAGPGSGCGRGLAVTFSLNQITLDGTWSVNGSDSGGAVSLSGTLQRSNGSTNSANTVVLRANPSSGQITWVFTTGGFDYVFSGIGIVKVQSN